LILRFRSSPGFRSGLWLQGVVLENGRNGNRRSFGISPVVAFFLLSLTIGFGFGARAAAQVPVYTPPVVANNDALANVRYDYRWELYLGPAYSHFNAGPNLIQGANLGGFDFQAAHWFRRHWAVAGNVRGYYGTSGVAPNVSNVRGPFVSETMFMAGPEYRGWSNSHASLTLHALFGGAYGDFTSGIGNSTPPITASQLGLFNNQTTFGGAFGGSIDLNRSPRLAFRISPDATLTDFGGAGLHEQFTISVGVVYRLDQVGRKHK